MSLVQINRNPTNKQLRQFAGVWMIAFGLLGFLIVWRTQSWTASIVLWAIAEPLSLAAMSSLPLAKCLYLGLSYLTFPIGWLVSHLTLAAVFYLVFTPVGVIMRLIGRDPLARRFEPARESYWQPHEPPSDKRRYFRQY